MGPPTNPLIMLNFFVELMNLVKKIGRKIEFDVTTVVHVHVDLGAPQPIGSKTWLGFSKSLFTFSISLAKHLVRCVENRMGRRKTAPQIAHSMPVVAVRLQGGKPIV